MFCVFYGSLERSNEILSLPVKAGEVPAVVVLTVATRGCSGLNMRYFVHLYSTYSAQTEFHLFHRSVQGDKQKLSQTSSPDFCRYFFFCDTETE